MSSQTKSWIMVISRYYCKLSSNNHVRFRSKVLFQWCLNYRTNQNIKGGNNQVIFSFQATIRILVDIYLHIYLLPAAMHHGLDQYMAKSQHEGYNSLTAANRCIQSGGTSLFRKKVRQFYSIYKKSLFRRSHGNTNENRDLIRA